MTFNSIAAVPRCTGKEPSRCVPVRWRGVRGTAALLALAWSSVGAAAQEAAKNEVAETFNVGEIRVLGNASLEILAVERAVYQFLGPGKTIETVEQARQALEKEYKNAGYGTVFADIPEQDVVDGIVRLRVTEGRIDRVRVTGARYFSNGRIRRAMTSLERGEVPHLPTVQAQLADLNARTADRAITPVLRAGRAPGTVDVELKVQDELPVHGGVEVSDRYSAQTSRLRAGASIGYGNLFQRGDTLALQYQTAPEEPDEARVLAATYLARVPGVGQLSLYAVDTDSDVATVGTLGVIGRGQVFGSRLTLPFAARGDLFHSVSFGVDYKDFKENIQFIDPNQPALETPINYAAWSLAYSGSLGGETDRKTFNLSGNFGIRGLANEPREFADKRFKARPNYFYVRGGAGYAHALPGDFALLARVSGQFAAEPLVSNEQFSLGGAETVRGYVESQVLADVGMSFSLELRTPSLRFASDQAQLYLLGFYDAGVGRLIDPLPDQFAQFDLASVGAGLRLRALGGLEAALDWGYPLVPSNDVLDGDSRIHFLVKYGF